MQKCKNLVLHEKSFFFLLILTMVVIVGRLVKVDINTIRVEKEHFVRICVEIDLT